MAARSTRCGQPIRWDVANLARRDDVKRHAAADVIFCRNVFIYFSDDAIRSTVRLFTEYMSPDGYLFLGASESLTRLGVELELAEIGGAFAYVKLGRRESVERLQASRRTRPRVRCSRHQNGDA